MTVLGDIEWYRGDGYPFELTILAKGTTTAIDITGYSFKLTVDETKDPEDDSTKLFDVDGVLDGDPTTGKVSFTPTSVNTDLEPDGYFYDVQMTDGSGNIRTIAKAKWKIVQDITK